MANSARNAIPVIFNSSSKNSLLIPDLLLIVFNKFIIPSSLLNIKNIIAIPAIIEIYIANSGLYCLIIIIIINDTSPIPIILMT